MAKNLDNYNVQKGDTYSADKALTVSFDVVENDTVVRRERFANEWDTTVPNAQEWRDSQDVKIDFSDVTLDTPPEEIEKKKQALLEQHPVPSAEEVQDSYKTFVDASDKFSKETAVSWIYDVVMQRLNSAEDFDKTLEYANKIIDNMINNQLYRLGEKDHRENIWDVESPFVNRWDKMLGRTSSPSKDPFFIIKESSYPNCDMGENVGDFIHELKEIKEMFPKTKEELKNINFSEREETFKTQFGERYTALDERTKAKSDLIGKVVQIDIRENYSKAFDKQLEEHIKQLEEQRKKEEINRKKEEIKARLAERDASKHENPLSGVVVADILAGHVRDKNALFEKDKARGIHGNDEKSPTMSRLESNELAKKFN